MSTDVTPPSGASAPGAAAPPAPAVRVRQNVDQCDITALRTGYATMQGRSEADNRSWTYWAEYHGFNRFDCWHHNAQGSHQYPYDLFLPWHRAYLLYFELTMLDGGGTPLPWWDWTSEQSHQIGIPAPFAEANAGDQPNPLASGPVPASLRTDPPRTTRNPGPPDQLPDAQTIEDILALTSFEDFSSQLQNQHDAVHGWTGGDMGVIATSAFDPIFWSHHCMIDRLWYLWQVRHGVSNIPPSYLSRVLAPWNLTVQDVLGVTALGYTYGASHVSVPFDSFTSAAV